MAAVQRRICGNDRSLARSQASPRRSPRPNKPLPLNLLPSLPEAGAWAVMRWPPWSSKSNNDDQQQQNTTSGSSSSLSTPTSQSPSSFLGWSDFIEPKTIIPTILLTSGILLGVRLHRSYLRRIPDAPSISPSWLRRRTIFGKVTSVGDGDNFRIYHTPGGRLAGWGWLPWKRVPTTKKELKDKTIHIRLAGIDAPELAHFGRPEQPFARDAHAWLTSYLLGRRIRASIHRQDQYNRVVGSVSVRRAFDFPPFRRRDVSYEMLKRGLATVYEAKIGAEFGGPANEKKYRKAEWWARKKYKGLWKDYKRIGSDWESPRAYKTRMGMGDVDNSGKSK